MNNKPFHNHNTIEINIQPQPRTPNALRHAIHRQAPTHENARSSLQRDDRPCSRQMEYLSDWTAAKKAVGEIGPVDLLVNNAGIVKHDAFLETEEVDLNKLFEVNVMAAVNVSQVVAKGMVDRGKGGAIVNISSTISHMAAPLRSSYCASKGALDQVTRVMALELGSHQIRTNSVNPTVVMTGMGRRVWADPAIRNALLSRTPQGKFAEVTDVVHPVLYLLSDKADMINGVTLNVDGGSSAV
ncbi:L-xylulose reductase [Lamellibrachia satsuma]|nr:L-xylulose reductase [Lamellibrachia satsuma]